MVQVDMNEKNFELRGNIPLRMDGLTLEGEIIGISNVSMSPTSDEIWILIEMCDANEV